MIYHVYFIKNPVVVQSSRAVIDIMHVNEVDINILSCPMSIDSASSWNTGFISSHSSSHWRGRISGRYREGAFIVGGGGRAVAAQSRSGDPLISSRYPICLDNWS